jgi:hypothetical protein
VRARTTGLKLCRPDSKMVAEAGVPVHFVEPWVAGHQEAIRLAEDAKTGTDVGTSVEAELHADALIQAKVLVGGELGKCLLGAADSS